MPFLGNTITYVVTKTYEWEQAAALGEDLEDLANEPSEKERDVRCFRFYGAVVKLAVYSYAPCGQLRSFQRSFPECVTSNSELSKLLMKFRALYYFS